MAELRNKCQVPFLKEGYVETGSPARWVDILMLDMAELVLDNLEADAEHIFTQLLKGPRLRFRIRQNLSTRLRDRSQFESWT